MLHLTRKENESILIDDTIEIVISKIGKGNVKLSFNFLKPDVHHNVLRKELYDKIRDENQKAMQIVSDNLDTLLKLE